MSCRSKAVQKNKETKYEEVIKMVKRCRKGIKSRNRGD